MIMTIALTLAAVNVRLQQLLSLADVPERHDLSHQAERRSGVILDDDTRLARVIHLADDAVEGGSCDISR